DFLGRGGGSGNLPAVSPWESGRGQIDSRHERFGLRGLARGLSSCPFCNIFANPTVSPAGAQMKPSKSTSDMSPANSPYQNISRSVRPDPNCRIAVTYATEAQQAA